MSKTHEVRIVVQIVSVDQWGGSRTIAERSAFVIPADTLGATSLVDIRNALRDTVDVDNLVSKVTP